MIKSQVKTATKKVLAAVNTGDKAAAAEAFKAATKVIDSAYNKGIYHVNTVARKKSSLAKLINKMA